MMLQMNFLYKTIITNLTQSFLRRTMKISEQTKMAAIRKPTVKNEQKDTLWDKIIHNIVRPPRMKYRNNQLNSFLKSLAGDSFQRRETTVEHLGKDISLSIYDSSSKNYKIILYLHGNSSCCLQAKYLLHYLPAGYSLAAFDFIGCGNNYQDDKISLGYRQSQQVQTVTNYLRSEHYQVILWGRSMGAVSALKYGKVDVIVADSPFRNIRKLFKQMTLKQKYAPGCIIDCFFPCVFHKLRKDVLNKGQYDLMELNIENCIAKISPTTAIIFLTGNNDTLIDMYNSNKLYNLFPGNKKWLQVVEGNHNDKRPEKSMIKIMALIDQCTKKHDIIKQPQNKIQESSDEGFKHLTNQNKINNYSITDNEIKIEIKEQ